MKLRNKKNGLLGELKDFINDGFIVKVPDGRGIAGYKYDSLNALNEEWEDYEPKEPLIKDEKIRKVVRAWAEVNDYKKCLVRVYDYDRMGCHFSEGVTSFVSYDTQLGITFFCVDLNIKTETVYTITELCGEEEE